MDKSELAKILSEHKKWIDTNLTEGKQANLRGADLQGAGLRGANLRGVGLRGADLRGADRQGAGLRGADLQGVGLRGADLRGADLRDADLRDADLRDADLRDADLDYNCWPLCCGSFNVIVDKKIAAQLAYHFCRLICDDEEVKASQKALYPLANQFHRVEECGKLGEIENK